MVKLDEQKKYEICFEINVIDKESSTTGNYNYRNEISCGCVALLLQVN